MRKKILIFLVSVLVVAGGIAAVAAFEAWVVNVTATIENALYVHPESQDFGTVFPQELHKRGFFVTTSFSFSETEQQRVKNIDYVVKQKPKPRLSEDAKWCDDNLPNHRYNPQSSAWQAYLAKCYYPLCPYLSKIPDGFPPPGNDESLPAYHGMAAEVKGMIDKILDTGDNWLIDLDTPCFEGQCAQDWQHPGAELPAELESEVFGCDVWVEVTKIY